MVVTQSTTLTLRDFQKKYCDWFSAGVARFCDFL